MAEIMGKGRYTDQSLNKTRNEIRLLQINTRGTLFVSIHSLESAPTYTALSYAWTEDSDGTIDGPQKIKIWSGGRLYHHSVTANLWLFLQRAKTQLSANTYLWIDALCIDQSKVLERNHQVGMMSSIYKQAGNILLWLGEASHAEHKLLTILRWMEPYVATEVQEGLPPRAWYPDFPLVADDTLQPNREWTRPTPGHLQRIQARITVVLEALQLICTRRYWSRLWIVQEFLLASSINIWLSSSSMTFAQLMSMIQSTIHAIQHKPKNQHLCPPLWEMMRFSSQDIQKSMNNCVSLCSNRMEYRKTQSNSSFERIFLDLWNDRGHGERLDAVYALSGLVWGEIEPDYAKSRESLLLEVLCLSQNKDCVALKRHLSRALAIPGDTQLSSDSSLRFSCQSEQMFIHEGEVKLFRPRKRLPHGLRVYGCTFDREPAVLQFTGLIVTKAPFRLRGELFWVTESAIAMVSQPGQCSYAMHDVALFVGLNEKGEHRDGFRFIKQNANAIHSFLDHSKKLFDACGALGSVTSERKDAYMCCLDEGSLNLAVSSIDARGTLRPFNTARRNSTEHDLGGIMR